MTIKTTSVLDDQMLLIVVFVGAILYILTRRSGGMCSLVNPRERFVLGAGGCYCTDRGDKYSECIDGLCLTADGHSLAGRRGGGCGAFYNGTKPKPGQGMYCMQPPTKNDDDSRSTYRPSKQYD